MMAADLVHLQEAQSTNIEAMHRAVAGARLPLWVAADRQTGGRGRGGRAWTTLPGNLAASCAVRIDAPPSSIAKLSLVAGISVIDAVRSLPGGKDIGGLALKWPNDLMVGDAKVGGILVESTNLATGLVAVMGFGVNLAAAPSIAGRVTAALGSCGLTADPVRLLWAIDAALAHWLTIWDADRGFAAVRKAWLERAMAIGTPIRVGLPDGTREGSFAGVNQVGELLLGQADGSIRTVTIGDVTLAHPPGENEAGKAREGNGKNGGEV
ncbi:MAG: biotin--[acetyl-CoA-carboxylase] ligase [Hyphomicrobiaceae bacterium]